MALYMIKANIRQAGVIRDIQERIIYSNLNFLIYLQASRSATDIVML